MIDVHPPEGPTHSLKDFAIHILAVTIGILIALGLEGVRESWHEHKAVNEARESFLGELRVDQTQLDTDLATVREAHAQLDQIVSDFSRLSRTPDELAKRVDSLSPGFYFFRTTAWESSVASGVLSHMKTDELNRFVNAYLSVKNYQDISRTTVPELVGVKSYFESRHSFSVADEADGERQLRTLQSNFQTMEHLGREFSTDVNAALKAP